MPQYMRDRGALLLRAGFPITPIIPNHKRPALKRWQRTDFQLTDIENYAGYGIGVRCGVGQYPLVAIDIDTNDPELAMGFETWCLDNLGDAPIRIGAPPKRLLVYRAESAGWSKVSSPWLEDLMGDKHRLEVLGSGQQFVAYGTHPEGREYEWIDMWGGLDVLSAEDCVVVSWGDVENALAEWLIRTDLTGLTPASPQSVDQTLGKGRAHGISSTRDPMASYEPPLGLSIDEARSVLNAGGGDPGNYDAWLRAGMALHHEFAGKISEPDGLQLWDDWSATAANYVGREDLEHRWDGFGRATAGGRRAMTLKYAIKAASEAAVRAGGGAAAGGAESSGEGSSGTGGEGSGNGVGRVPPGGRPAFYLNTEAGNAKRMVDTYGRDLLWCAELNQWFRWSGVYWRPVPLTEVRHLAAFAVDALREDLERLPEPPAGADTSEYLKAKAELLKWCASSQRWAMYDHMVSIASLEPHLWVKVEELDREAMLLGVANGAVDLRTGALVAPDRAHRITRISPVAYDPDAKAPWFERTIREVFRDDEEMVRFFQRVIGYILMGAPVEDLLIILFGPGNNGKSTLMNAIRRALGQHAAVASANIFMRDGAGGASGGGGGGNAGGARPDLLALNGVRLAAVTEPEEGGELREAVIKSMTGGEALPARALYSSTVVQIQPTWTAVMATNHKPVVKGDDYGIWRRLLLIPFERDFDHDPTIVKDTHREARLLAELPGILAWCVQGAVEYQRVGLCIPGIVERSRQVYRGEMDLLADWLGERCTLDNAANCTLDQLWLDWEPWARARGELRYVQSRKALKKRLENKGYFAERTKAGYRFLGLKLQTGSICEEK